MPCPPPGDLPDPGIEAALPAAPALAGGTLPLSHPRGYGLPRGALVIKNPPASEGDMKTGLPSLGQEDPLEEGTATHSRILAWRIPWTEEPGEPQPIASQSRTRLK